MATNNMMFNPAAMQQIGQLPLMFTNEGLSWMDKAKQADAATLQDINAQRQRAAEAHPLDMAQKQATLADTQAITTGRNINNEFAPKEKQADLDAKLFKLTKDRSDEELNTLVRQAEKMMMSDDPRQREAGAAVYERMPAVIEKRKAAAAAKAAADQEDATKRRGQDLSFAGVKYGADARMEQARIAAQARMQKATQDMPKMNDEQFISYYTNLMFEAQRAGDMQAAQDYNNIIQFRRQASPVTAPGTMPNPAVFQGGQGGQPLVVPRPAPGVPGLPPIAPAQGSQPTPQRPAQKLVGPAAEDWISRAVRQNPGMSREQVIEEGRKAGKL